MMKPFLLFRQLFACLFGLACSISAESQTVYIRLNQLGFLPDDSKTAVVFGDVPEKARFNVIDDATSKKVLVFRSDRLASPKWGAFGTNQLMDFSSLKKTGTYHLEFNGAKSHSFRIITNLYASVPDTMLEFMRQQRCGYNPFLDTSCHTGDGRTAFGPQTNGAYLDATGGWHDAGDLLKYLLTSGNATAQMLMAYQLQPGIFGDRFDALGKSGSNGIPDILDEAKWGLDWMLKLHPSENELYHQVADDRDHAGFHLPQNDTVDYGWGRGSNRVVYCATGQPQGLRKYQSESTGLANLAGRYAAAMALACQIWKDDPAQKKFACQCLKAGEEVYRMGLAKPGVQQGNSYGSPYRYAETTWADDMEWGAAELFLATGNFQYLDDAIRFAKLIGSESWMGREQTGHYQYYPFMNVGHFVLHAVVDAKLKKVLEQYYRDGIEQCLKAGERNPYDIGVPFIWCSNNLTVALATQILFYERMTGDMRYHRFLCNQRDWLLGRNPWGTSMISGIPEHAIFPQDMHLQTTSLTHRSVRGGLVDGPVYRRIFLSLKGVSIKEPDPLALFQDERAVYHDCLSDYSSNEPTMDGTASAILMMSLW